MLFEKIKTWLSPVVTGIVGLIAAGTIYLNEGRDRTAETVHYELDKRLTIVEGQASQIQPLVKQLTDLNIRLTELVVKMELFHKEK